LQEEDRLAQAREESNLQIKRERAQKLAIKRGLSDGLSGDRPRSSGQTSQASLKDAIPLRRGRSSTLQSQQSELGSLRGRSSTVTSQNWEMPATKIGDTNAQINPPEAPVKQSHGEEPCPSQSLDESDAAPEEQNFTDFIEAKSSDNKCAPQKSY
jgi:hypothetical protein